MNLYPRDATETTSEATLRHVCNLSLDRIEAIRIGWIKQDAARPGTAGQSGGERELRFGAMTLAAFALSSSDQVPQDLSAFMESLALEKRQPPSGLLASRTRVARFQRREAARERFEAMAGLINPELDLSRARAGETQEPRVLENLEPDFQAIREMAFEIRKPFLTFMELEGPFDKLVDIQRSFQNSLVGADIAAAIDEKLNEPVTEHAL